MKFNFDEIIDRRNTNCVKWDDCAADELPMWVADMDFRTAPCITEALRKRVEQGIFGYTLVPDSYYDSLNQWFTRRHGWPINREWVIYTSGVIPALSTSIKALTHPTASGNMPKVLVQTPVYNHFFSSIINNKCEVVASPLLPDGDSWVMDYADLEMKAADPDVQLMILCNPHNPCGRVWTREELKRLGDICMAYGVSVISDEIHCELVMPGYKYTPYASVCPEFEAASVTCISPSKAFNIAGLQIANIVCADPDMRRRIDRAINDNEVCDVNPFGVIALQAAYNEGGEWLDALNEYICDNYRFMVEYCSRNLPQFPLTKLEGTYLVWMDCRSTGIPSDDLEQELRDIARLRLNSGSIYGAAGNGYIRWNIACPRARLLEGLTRFSQYINNR